MAKQKRLTDDEVRAIHKSNMANAVLAEKYGVSIMTVWRIKKGVTHCTLRLGATKKYRELDLQRELTEYYKRKRAEKEGQP